ncbi:MAG: hydrogenase [Burkholderiales bacterium]
MSLPPPESPAVPPLIARLVSHHGARWVGADGVDEFASEPGDHVLFLGGDPVRFPECLDVAVIVPELQGAFPGRFTVGVVPREQEAVVARRFGVNRWPALVFLRGGRYVTALTGMHDWTDFLSSVEAALTAPATRPPGVGIPVVPGAGGT